MEILLLVVFVLGFLAGRRSRRFTELRIKMQIPADVQVSVSASAVVKDSEGNVISSSPDVEISSIEVVPAELGSAAEVDENWVFNPGLAGAEGTLTVFAEVDGIPSSGSVDLELVAGAPAVTELAVELTPL